MSISADLLAQARSLATSDPKKPKQANLRRAVSSAYYALFHFLSEEAAKNFVGAGPQVRMRRDLARRAVAHTRLKDVCQEFLKPTPRDLLKPYWAPAGIRGNNDIATVCQNLISLQEFRHVADYDFSVSVSRSQALDACDNATEAMEAWNTVKTRHPDAVALFSMCVLLWPGLSARS
jgi:uncharacterized protein (UPF0332 family)